TDIQVIAGAAGQSLVADGWRTGDRVDGRCFEIFERDLLRLEGIARLFDAAGGEHALLGREVILIELMESGRAEAYQALVLIVAGLRNGGEQLGVKDGADLAADVVEHAVGVDGAIALAEDD